MDFFGLSQYFDFDHSGFAFDYYYRDDLARNALAIARRTWGDDIEAMYVIGDTPHDIQCGKAIAPGPSVSPRAGIPTMIWPSANPGKSFRPFPNRKPLKRFLKHDKLLIKRKPRLIILSLGFF